MPKLQASYTCSLLLAMDLIGGKWKLRILRHITEGATRFSSLKRTMPDISEKMLATQLNDLEASGIIRRHIIAAKPLHIEYELAAGQDDLVEAIDKLCNYAAGYAGRNGIAVKTVPVCRRPQDK